MTAPHRAQTIWRTVAIVASVTGIASLPAFRNQLNDGRIVIWIVFALPFAVALVAVTAPMENRTRILGLGLASVLASFVAMISFWTGFGLVVIPIILAYLIAALGLNEASTPAA